MSLGLWSVHYSRRKRMLRGKIVSNTICSTTSHQMWGLTNTQHLRYYRSSIGYCKSYRPSVITRIPTTRTEDVQKKALYVPCTDTHTSSRNERNRYLFFTNGGGATTTDELLRVGRRRESFLTETTGRHDDRNQEHDL